MTRMKNNIITTVRIDRTKWLRGGKDPKGRVIYDFFLWDLSKNAGCCLGHAIKQVCNLPERELDSMRTPEDVFDVFTGSTFLTDSSDFAHNHPHNNTFAEKAMEINDKRTYSDAYRERRLVALFRRNGLKLEFFN